MRAVGPEPVCERSPSAQVPPLAHRLCAHSWTQSPKQSPLGPCVEAASAGPMKARPRLPFVQSNVCQQMWTWLERTLWHGRRAGNGRRPSNMRPMCCASTPRVKTLSSSLNNASEHFLARHVRSSAEKTASGSLPAIASFSRNSNCATLPAWKRKRSSSTLPPMSLLRIWSIEARASISISRNPSSWHGYHAARTVHDRMDLHIHENARQ